MGDDTPRQGFYVGEGTYDTYARNLDPLGDEVRGSVDKHLAPHANVGGDGFSEIGHETGLADAYASRMLRLQEKIRKLGGNWHEMADSSRRTRDNYNATEDDHRRVIGDLGKELG